MIRFTNFGKKVKICLEHNTFYNLNSKHTLGFVVCFLLIASGNHRNRNSFSNFETTGSIQYRSCVGDTNYNW